MADDYKQVFTKMKFEAQLRAKCIELIGLWEGTLTTNRISDWFQVSRQAVSTDIKRYNESINPNSLLHRPSVKAFISQDNMHPALTPGRFKDYMQFIRLMEPNSYADVSELEGLRSPIDPLIFQKVLRATTLRSPIHLRYLIDRAPGNTQLTGIPTQVFIADGQPWIRVWQANINRYSSLALSRIQLASIQKQESKAVLPVDEHWQQGIQLRIQPNPGLSAPHQLMIEQINNMPMGHALMRLPIAWVPFFIRSNRIAASVEQAALTDVFELQIWSEDWPKIQTILEQESPWWKDGNV